MGVIEDAFEAVGLRQVDGFAQQLGRVLAAAVEHEGAQAEQCDAQAPLLELLRPGVGTPERIESLAPLPGRDRGMTARDVAPQLDVATPEPPARAFGPRQQCVDLRAQVATGFGTEAARMNAHLLGQAGDAQPRYAARHAHRMHRRQQLERAVLGAGRGGEGHGSVGELHRLRKAAALDHVESMDQQCHRLVGLVALPQGGGEQRRQHRREGSAAAELAVGASQRRAQHLLGEPHLSFPQVAVRPRMKSPQRPT